MGPSAHDPELDRLRSRIAREKAQDARARETDAARHLRAAIDLLEGCIEPNPRNTRVAELLVEAADLLTEGGS